MFLGVAVIAAVAVYAISDKLIDKDQPFKIVVDPSSGVTIEAHAGEGIETLIDRAFDQSAAAVGGVLADRGFYKLHSDNMITALALADPATLPESALRRYRKLLGEFEGPFRRPGALLESDGRLLSAIEDRRGRSGRRGRRTSSSRSSGRRASTSRGSSVPGCLRRALSC